MKIIKKMLGLMFLLSILALCSNTYAAGTAQYTGNLVPAMTSNTSPSPYVIEASDTYNAFYLPHKAFDGNVPGDSSSEWFSVKNTDPSANWIKIDFGANNSKKVSKMVLTNGFISKPADGVKDWELWASNDNINFIKLTQGVAESFRNEYFFDNQTAYRYYRLNVLSAHTGGYVAVTELEFMEVIASAIQAPTNLKAVSLNSKVDLSWDSVINATGYNIKRATSIGGPYATIANNVTTTVYSDTTATNGATYYYVVTSVNATTESVNSNEVSVTPKAPTVTLDITSVDKARIGDEIIADVVIHNATNITAEDIKLVYDTTKLDYIGSLNVSGMKIYKEDKSTVGTLRFITASLGKANAANGDKVLLQLRFKAKATGLAKIDIVRGRVADNATLEADVASENCGEKSVLIEGIKDVNRSGEFTLLDLGIAAWYYGDPESATHTALYDADVVDNNQIDDNDLNTIVSEMLSNTNYPGNS